MYKNYRYNGLVVMWSFLSLKRSVSTARENAFLRLTTPIVDRVKKLFVMGVL